MAVRELRIDIRERLATPHVENGLFGIE